ncbi:enoyl-CoA hydratase/isomerase family protein [Agrobacterium sp. T29]|uniref:enoyl-CoA hydratase/isomerase family protein n=1 Tax=Agrobacterium sp. T29 TaxID=2580515 RepID=UPI00115F3A99|nr:enoyl-CoA hydratase/isomerase family protein [Agrobacterium sp. T29]
MSDHVSDTMNGEKECVLFEEDGAVRQIILNRPDKLNAIDTNLAERLYAEIEKADEDSGVRAVVLMANGRMFCAGGDLAEYKDAGPEAFEAVEHRSRLISRTHELIRNLSKPVVAAVKGGAYGGGAALAVACDMVVIGQDTRFSFPEIRNGIVPAVVMAGLAHSVGRKLAFEIASLGEPVSTERMVAAGLANYVVPEAEVNEKALVLAHRWASFEPDKMAATKKLFYKVVDLAFEDATEAGRDVNTQEHRAKLARNAVPAMSLDAK